MSQSYPQFPLTNFPQNVDTFLPFLNISPSDLNLLKQYQTALENNDPATAQSVFALIPNGIQKIVNSTNLNQLREAVLAMEQFYKTDVKPYITNKQTEWQNIVNRFQYKDTFNSTQSYERNNIVSYNLNGLTQIYLNTYVGTTPTGTYPTNTTYWRVLTIRGVKGDSGGGSTFAFEWDSSVSYIAGTIVVSGNAWWNATQPSTNQQPAEGSPYWELVLNITQTIYPVQPAPPAPSQSTGELWFKVI